MFQKPTQVAHLALFLQAENVFEQAGQALKRGVDSVLDAGGQLTNLSASATLLPGMPECCGVDTLLQLRTGDRHCLEERNMLHWLRLGPCRFEPSFPIMSANIGCSAGLVGV